MRKLIKLLWLLIIPLLLAGCKPNKENHKNVPPGYKVLTIQAQPFQKKLYFASRIMPLTCEPLTSMADGIVMAKNFQYGKKVTKGDLLFTIRSTKEQLDYQAALTRYFQAKQYFSQSMNDYQSNATLWQKGIVSQDTYVRSQRDYLSNRLALLQAEANLRKFLKTEQEFSSLEKLSMENTAEVDRVLQLDKLAREINIYAPQTGLAVFKAKGSDADKTINVGDEVKNGQMLLCIAVNSAIALDIDIGEINLHQIFVSQDAEVVFEAAPKLVLHGRVESIEAQAQGGGQLPVFSARVAVRNLDKEVLDLLRVGMSAKVSISVQHAPDLLVPLKAVIRQGSQFKVKVLGKNGEISEVLIDGGETTSDNVAVVSGLKAGDQILVPN